MNKKISLGTTVFLCILVFIVGFMSSWTVLRASYNSQMNELLLQYPEAVKLMEIIGYYDKYYVNSADMERAETLALKGFVGGIGDKYSQYYTAEEYQQMLSDDNGELVGIGVSVMVGEDNTVVIERVVPESPAQKAGIEKGDVIVSVDGKMANGDIEKLANAIKGEVGTDVSLVVLRGGKELSFTVQRQMITTESVYYEYISEHELGFIRIFGFDNTTPKQFKNALDVLKGKGAKGFIFDLRDNGGGLLTSIVGVLEALLPKDTVVTTAVEKGGKETVYKTKNGVDDFSYPCAVLINRYTASAAELFTSALRDYEKAVIVGERSYGKGVMQSTVKLSDGSALKLTTAYYSSPKGENYDGIGIKPQIEAYEERIDYYLANTSDKVIKAAINELEK